MVRTFSEDLYYLILLFLLKYKIPFHHLLTLSPNKMDYQSRLNSILNKPGNKTCADCNGRNPRWASISLGVFVCIRCCGIHRALGTHISKMKSTTLDKWSPQMFQIFESIDNDFANNYWEQNMPKSHNKPVESSGSYAVETFLRDKYERKLWIGSGPDPVQYSMQPRKVETVALKVEKKEDKRNLSAGPIVTDLLSVHNEIGSYEKNAGTHQPHLSAPDLHVHPKSVTHSNYPHHMPPSYHQNHSVPPTFQSAPLNLFPNNLQPAPVFKQELIAPQGNNGIAYSQGVQGGAGVQSQGVINFPQATFTQNPPNNFGMVQGGQPAPGYAANANAQKLEAEKNMKISQVLSMYSAQPTPVPNSGTGFQPLGAIAAQNFFNQKPHSQPYPTF